MRRQHWHSNIEPHRKAFPQLNLALICSDEGTMLMHSNGDNTLNADYRQAYEAAMLQIEALNNIINQLNQ